MASQTGSGGGERSVSPFTVAWFCRPDRFVIFSRVWAEDANQAVIEAAQQHSIGVWRPKEIQVLFVLKGHHRAEMLEVDDRFTFFSNGVTQHEGESQNKSS